VSKIKGQKEEAADSLRGHGAEKSKENQGWAGRDKECEAGRAERENQEKARSRRSHHKHCNLSKD